MSERYPGGIISKTGVTPSGSYETSTAPGVWTLDQQAYWQQQGNWPTQGNVLNYIEDLFSTYLYTGTGSAQTITNGIDLSTKGGLVWIKQRVGTGNHTLFDTARGAYFRLRTDTTEAQVSTSPNGVTSFTSSGFSLAGASSDYNGSAETLVSWTFREQPKFFDIVTYTGDGTGARDISHNLGSAPGFVIHKRTNASNAWYCYHQALGTGQYIQLNLVDGAGGASLFPSVTSSVVRVSGGLNASGATYVMYLFAHNAGGFSASGSGSTNGITCGSYTGTGTAGLAVTLGYEPQWVLIKNATTAGNDWQLTDVMRGMDNNTSRYLSPNASYAEGNTGQPIVVPTATGFTIAGDSTWTAWNSSGDTYIYIAIRRGPMKTPTLGTSVFKSFYTNSTSGTAQTTNFPVDWQWGKPATGAFNYEAPTRLLGVSTLPAYSSQPELFPNTTAAEGFGTGNSYNWTNTTFGMPDPFGGNQTALWAWSRAPGYFDVVAYTGNSVTGRQVTHNLGVAPELFIVKNRTSAGENWEVYSSTIGNTRSLLLNTTAGSDTKDVWNNTSPTSTYIVVGFTGQFGSVNASANNYVAYLFATCAGVSKVGSYTGSAALQTINCGFTTGARYILIKRTDSTGDWYIWDSARGISSGNDPYFVISTAAQVTGTNYVDTDTTGFKVTAAASTTVNISAATYIFLAIA